MRAFLLSQLCSRLQWVLAVAVFYHTLQKVIGIQLQFCDSLKKSSGCLLCFWIFLTLFQRNGRFAVGFLPKWNILFAEFSFVFYSRCQERERRAVVKAALKCSCLLYFNRQYCCLHLEYPSECQLTLYIALRVHLFHTSITHLTF